MTRSLHRALRDLLERHGRFVKFAIIGCSNALISALLFNLLMTISFIDGMSRIVFAQSIAYTVGAVWSFWWNRHWAFASPGREESNVACEGLRFIILQLAAIALSSLLLWILIEQLYWAALPSWIVTMTIVTALNYIAMAEWIFRSTRPATKGLDTIRCGD